MKEDLDMIYALYRFKLKKGIEKRGAMETSLCEVIKTLENTGCEEYRMQKLCGKAAKAKEKKRRYLDASDFYKKAGRNDDVIRTKEKAAKKYLNCNEFGTAIRIFEETKNEKMVRESWKLLAREIEYKRSPKDGAIDAYKKAGLYKEAERVRKKFAEEFRLNKLREEFWKLEDKIKDREDFEIGESYEILWQQVSICKELGYQNDIRKIAEIFHYEDFFEDAGIIYEWLGDKTKAKEMFGHAGRIWTGRDIRKAVECYERAGYKENAEGLKNELESN